MRRKLINLRKLGRALRGFTTFEMHLSQILDPASEVLESGREVRELLDALLFVVWAQAHEGIDSATATRGGVGDAEDVGCGISCLGVAKEDGTAGGGC